MADDSHREGPLMKLKTLGGTICKSLTTWEAQIDEAISEALNKIKELSDNNLLLKDKIKHLEWQIQDLTKTKLADYIDACVQVDMVVADSVERGSFKDAFIQTESTCDRDSILDTTSISNNDGTSITGQSVQGVEDAMCHMPDWSSNQTGESLSIADSLKQAADAALLGLVYDDKSGMYYDYNSGYYYDATRALYYEPSTGTYYSYDEETRTHKVHSQVDVSQQNQYTSHQAHDQINSHDQQRTCGEKLDPYSAWRSNESSYVHKDGSSSHKHENRRKQKKRDKKKSPDSERKEVSKERKRKERKRKTESTDRNKKKKRKLDKMSSEKDKTSSAKDKMMKKKKKSTEKKSGNKESDENKRKENNNDEDKKMKIEKKNPNEDNETDKKPSNQESLDDDVDVICLEDKQENGNNRDELESIDSSSDSSFEEGELSDSESELSDSNAEESKEERDEKEVKNYIVILPEEEKVEETSARYYPPCIRAMVKQSDHVDVGTLYMITVTGGTVGREKNLGHTIEIQDPQISKMHAEIRYDEAQRKYVVKDHASQNGTFLNGARVAEAKVMSAAYILAHMDKLQFGSTVLELHIHSGTDTCSDCEPGLVQASIKTETKADTEIEVLSKAEKEKKRRQMLKMIKSKYALQNMDYEGNKGVHNPDYEDKADSRRKTVGSDNPYQKDDAPASVDRAISADNKGHKLLEKMGWKEGDSLGKSQPGIQEPIKIDIRSNQHAGLGSRSAHSVSMDNVAGAVAAAKWIKVQKRFDDLEVKSQPVGQKKQKVWVQGETVNPGDMGQ